MGLDVPILQPHRMDRRSCRRRGAQRPQQQGDAGGGGPAKATLGDFWPKPGGGAPSSQKPAPWCKGAGGGRDGAGHVGGAGKPAVAAAAKVPSKVERLQAALAEAEVGEFSEAALAALRADLAEARAARDMGKPVHLRLGDAQEKLDKKKKALQSWTETVEATEAKLKRDRAACAEAAAAVEAAEEELAKIAALPANAQSKAGQEGLPDEWARFLEATGQGDVMVKFVAWQKEQVASQPMPVDGEEDGVKASEAAAAEARGRAAARAAAGKEPQGNIRGRSRSRSRGALAEALGSLLDDDQTLEELRGLKGEDRQKRMGEICEAKLAAEDGKRRRTAAADGEVAAGQPQG